MYVQKELRSLKALVCLRLSQASVAEVQQLRARAEKEAGCWPSAAEAPEASRQAISLLEPGSPEDEAEAALQALQAICCSLLAASNADAAQSRARAEAVGLIFEEAFSSERVLKARRPSPVAHTLANCAVRYS